MSGPLSRLPDGERQPLLVGATAFRPPVQAEDLTLAPVNLKGLLAALRNHIGLIACLTLLTTGVATYLVRREKPFYSSTAVIRLNDARGALAGPLADRTVQRFGESVDPIRSQVEILSSRAVGALVVDSVPELRLRVSGIPASFIRNLDATAQPGGDTVHLQLGPSLVTARAESSQAQARYGSIMHVDGFRFSVDQRSPGTAGLRLLTRESAIHNLLGRLTVKPRPATDVIDVSYLDLDPKLASKVVNAVVTVYQSVNAQTAQQQSIRRRKFLEGQLHYNDSVLDAARSALSAFRGRQRAYSTKTKLSTEQAGLSGLDVRREELEADRRVYQSLLSQLQARGRDRDGLGAIMSAPGIAANPVVMHVYEQLVRYQLARDSLTTGAFGRTEASPQVQRLDSLLAATQRDMIAAVQNVLVSTDARVKSLEELRAKNATAFPELSATEDEESRLEEDVEAARKTASSLREEYEKARMAEAVEVGQVEIVDLATLPGSRVGIGPFRKIALAFLVGLTLSCALALLLEHLNTSIRRREQVGTTLQIPELSVIPKAGVLPGRRHAARLARRNGNGAGNGSGQVADLLLAATDLQSSGAEAYRLLRTNLIFSQPSDAPSRILVTSPAPGDGKTTVSANLAVCFAQQGMRVLLVDCDLRRGRLHHLFRVSQTPGLAHVLLGTASLEEAVRITPVSGLSLMPVGMFPPGPAELLGSEAMRDFLQKITNDFPVVILDAPPVLAASDAAIVASLADATVLVLRAGRTDQADAQHTLQQLNAVGARVVGAVLNDPDARLRSQGAYYYSGYYGPDR